MSLADEELLEHLQKLLGESVTAAGDRVTVLWGSETGNAEDVGKALAGDLRRRQVKVRAMAMDDFDFDDLADQKRVIFVAATCGQVRKFKKIVDQS